MPTRVHHPFIARLLFTTKPLALALTLFPICSNSKVPIRGKMRSIYSSSKKGFRWTRWSSIWRTRMLGMFSIQISRSHSLLSKMLARGFLNSLPHSLFYVIQFCISMIVLHVGISFFVLFLWNVRIYLFMHCLVIRWLLVECNIEWSGIRLRLWSITSWWSDGLVMLGSAYGCHWSLITFYSASCCRENALFCKENYFSRNCGHYRNSVFIGYMLFSTK